MKKQVIYLLVVLFFTFPLMMACNNSSDHKSSTASNQLLFKMEDIDAKVLEADSLVLVYYKDPYGSDSVRYTRFYTQYSVTEKKDLQYLRQQLQSNFERQEFRNRCRGEGKIWCFSKGKILQTLYFSTNCATNCCYVYLIKDGMFYYCTPGTTTINWLNDSKLLAKETQ